MSPSSAYFLTASSLASAAVLAAVLAMSGAAGASPLATHLDGGSSVTPIAAKKAERNWNSGSTSAHRGNCSRKRIYFENCNWLQTTCGGKVVHFSKLNC
ncbi:MAG: hypothetical protein AB7L18_11720, partial [Hyphomicrobiaceae bacterium]